MSLLLKVAFDLVADSLWRKRRGRDDACGANEMPHLGTPVLSPVPVFDVM